ncbi:hypothetical protein DCAR_0101857 [Daucus carota subsp. sativus]|uniref:Uncharacterized protein n=1 Tax=Daucus carota subsp. sativus TaxID=79200 RepID=A0A166GPF5_DAUCS|nr:hypothetical protein DCAR_0101857 [Daucus carota subsp. sativus]
MEEEVSKALSANNINLMRYACNRLERIKRCGGKNILDEVAKGNPKAMEEALKRLLISNWEGPVVKFEDASLQKRLEECEFIHKRFILQSQKWVDENFMEMVRRRCAEGLRMASNQTHYKSLRNMAYGKSFAEVVVGSKLRNTEREAEEEGNGKW